MSVQKELDYISEILKIIQEEADTLVELHDLICESHNEGFVDDYDEDKTKLSLDARELREKTQKYYEKLLASLGA